MKNQNRVKIAIVSLVMSLTALQVSADEVSESNVVTLWDYYNMYKTVKSAFSGTVTSKQTTNSESETELRQEKSCDIKLKENGTEYCAFVYTPFDGDVKSLFQYDPGEDELILSVNEHYIGESFSYPNSLFSAKKSNLRAEYEAMTKFKDSCWNRYVVQVKDHKKIFFQGFNLDREEPDAQLYSPGSDLKTHKWSALKDQLGNVLCEGKLQKRFKRSSVKDFNYYRAVNKTELVVPFKDQRVIVLDLEYSFISGEIEGARYYNSQKCNKMANAIMKKNDSVIFAYCEGMRGISIRNSLNLATKVIRVIGRSGMSQINIKGQDGKQDSILLDSESYKLRYQLSELL